MEIWSFPPSYDEAYRPAGRTAATGFPVRETMPRGGPRGGDPRAPSRRSARYAYEHAPLLPAPLGRGRLSSRSALKSLEDFEDEVPGHHTKRTSARPQAAHPPFGDYLCVPDARDLPRPRHERAPPDGPRPSPSAATTGAAIANAHARIMWGMGIRPGDMVCVAAIFSLYMGSWGALAGAERLGAKAFPFRRGRRRA